MEKRYFLYLKFKGTKYHGWQIQPNGISVQEEVEQAIAILLQKKIALTAAGRTDAGVHASCMVAHFEHDKNIVRDKFMFHLNNILSESISIYDLKEVTLDFHARFAAKSRTYRYSISADKNPFQEEITHRYSKKIELEKMNEAARLMLGERDFSCFSKSKTQTFTNNCDLQKAEWFEKDGTYIFEIRANRFLRNMVRAIVGTLLEVGEGKRTLESIPVLIDSKDRSNAGVSVPAKGLFLVDIEYPGEGFI
ncbi:MAG: tRNA pseudouridine(38-40) synthase TruA [Flavobacteriales bacterium]|nr:tRNA pseudouridine(38-40) synthase TruA [Flavobacteriales bacterium]